MISQQSDFYFKGERSYVQGPTIFEAFRGFITRLYEKPFDRLVVKKFKVAQYVIQNSLMKVFEVSGLADKQDKKNILAEMLGAIEGKTFFVGLYDQGRTSIERRMPSLEKQYIGSISLLGSFSGEAKLIKIKNHYDLMQGIVEANKQIHLLSLPKTDQSYQIKFASLSGFQCPYQIEGSNASLEIKNVGMQENSIHRLTFNQLTLEVNGQESKLNMCYSFKKL